MTTLPSLEQFALGDGGGPACLIAHDAERFRGTSDEMRTVVDLWFREEREHARLLTCAAQRLGGSARQSHWSFSAFCACRRVLGVRFELQVLLLTEVVSTAYYKVLRRHVPDEPIRDMCGLILRDEAGHVAFHRDRLRTHYETRNVLPGFLWMTQFWVLGHSAAMILWINHGPCLRGLGSTRREYFLEVQVQLGRFLRRLHREAGQKPLPHFAIDRGCVQT